MKRFVKYAGFVLTPLSLLAVGIAGVEVARRLATGHLTVEPGWLVAALAAQVVGYLALAWGFAKLIGNYVSPAPRFSETAELYYRSLLARYLPGKVGLPAARLAGAAKLGVAPSILLASVAVEGLAWVGTGALLTTGLAVTLGRHDARMLPLPGMVFVVLGCVLLGLLALCIVDRRRYPAFVLRLVPEASAEGPLLPASLVGANALTWIVQAVSCALIVRSVGGTPDLSWLAAFASLASSLAGFLALPVPAGMGVREAMIVFLLGESLGAERALAVALIVRASGLALEFTVWLTALALVPRTLGKEKACES